MTVIPTERGRELDAAVAREVMGWTRVKGLYWRNREGANRYADEAMFSSDFAAVFTVETEIERRELVHRYLHLLTTLLIDSRSASDQGVETREWALIRATSEQRCLAALAAVRAKT